jgi:hypothetical protein
VRARKIHHQASANWRFADLIQVGETWSWATTPQAAGGLGQDLETFGLPLENASWTALSALARAILEPLGEHFDRPVLSYAFAGPALTRLVARRVGRIAPRLDQHASCERNTRGGLICPRGGAAVDLTVPGLGGFDLARWLVANVPFDRLYVYQDSRPIHVSHAPNPSGLVYHVLRDGQQVRPRRLNPLTLANLERQPQAPTNRAPKDRP